MVDNKSIQIRTDLKLPPFIRIHEATVKYISSMPEGLGNHNSICWNTSDTVKGVVFEFPLKDVEYLDMQHFKTFKGFMEYIVKFDSVVHLEVTVDSEFNKTYQKGYRKQWFIGYDDEKGYFGSEYEE